ncbi:DUF4232 domain-containing protein [Streptomyces sp. NBC_00083]|uniref:DUF4232 domain-containing protein n=1 Tax=Streptomyces sp. NBC_00083 TaxID=2975647 RepID=UPI00224D79F4|nr:DUF4232 domain-containing protein [Streptomyces sp. NBC_00083]MCX5387930.1 DUF4232 domain-containing protein [Streptomyces sp. NBC_00083]
MSRPHTARLTTLALLTAGLTLALTACGTGGGSGTATPDSPSATGTGSPSGSPGADGGRTMAPSGGSSGGGTNTGAGTGAGTGTGAGPAGSHCLTSQLAFAVAPGSGARSEGSQGAITVTLTNRAAKPCAMRGYPGVDLVGGATRWSLTRGTAESPATVTVRPGATTTFTLFYLPFHSGDGKEFTPKEIVVTPPDETHSHTLPWTFSAVLLQDGATHPGTYIGPIGSK